MDSNNSYTFENYQDSLRESDSYHDSNTEPNASTTVEMYVFQGQTYPVVEFTVTASPRRTLKPRSPPPLDYSDEEEDMDISMQGINTWRPYNDQPPVDKDTSQSLSGEGYDPHDPLQSDLDTGVKGEGEDYDDPHHSDLDNGSQDYGMPSQKTGHSTTITTTILDTLTSLQPTQLHDHNTQLLSNQSSKPSIPFMGSEAGNTSQLDKSTNKGLVSEGLSQPTESLRGFSGSTASTVPGTDGASTGQQTQLHYITGRRESMSEQDYSKSNINPTHKTVSVNKLLNPSTSEVPGIAAGISVSIETSTHKNRGEDPFRNQMPGSTKFNSMQSIRSTLQTPSQLGKADFIITQNHQDGMPKLFSSTIVPTQPQQNTGVAATQFSDNERLSGNEKDNNGERHSGNKSDIPLHKATYTDQPFQSRTSTRDNGQSLNMDNSANLTTLQTPTKEVSVNHSDNTQTPLYNEEEGSAAIVGLSKALKFSQLPPQQNWNDNWKTESLLDSHQVDGTSSVTTSPHQGVTMDKTADYTEIMTGINSQSTSSTQSTNSPLSNVEYSVTKKAGLNKDKMAQNKDINSSMDKSDKTASPTVSSLLSTSISYSNDQNPSTPSTVSTGVLYDQIESNNETYDTNIVNKSSENDEILPATTVPTHFLYKTYRVATTSNIPDLSNVQATKPSKLSTIVAPTKTGTVKVRNVKNPNKSPNDRRNYTHRKGTRIKGVKTTSANVGVSELNVPTSVTPDILNSTLLTQIPHVNNTTMANDIGTGPAIGIVIGCIIAFWIILGPVICIVCRIKEKTKARRSRSQEDEMGTRLVEEMVRMELAKGRDKRYQTSVSDMREIEPLQILNENDYENLPNLGICTDKSVIINDESYIGYSKPTLLPVTQFDSVDKKKLPYIIDGNNIFKQFNEEELKEFEIRFIDASSPILQNDISKTVFNFNGYNKSNASISVDSGIEKTANSTKHDISSISIDDKYSTDLNGKCDSPSLPNESSSIDKSFCSSPALSEKLGSLPPIYDETAGSLTQDSTSMDSTFSMDNQLPNNRAELPQVHHLPLKSVKIHPTKYSPLNSIDPSKYLICNNHIASLEKGAVYAELNKCHCAFRASTDNSEECLNCSVTTNKSATSPDDTPRSTPKKALQKLRQNGKIEYERIRQDTTV